MDVDESDHRSQAIGVRPTGLVFHAHKVLAAGGVSLPRRLACFRVVRFGRSGSLVLWNTSSRSAAAAFAGAALGYSARR
jgi:hypothetical protein